MRSTAPWLVAKVKLSTGLALEGRTRVRLAAVSVPVRLFQLSMVRADTPWTYRPKEITPPSETGSELVTVVKFYL